MTMLGPEQREVAHGDKHGRRYGLAMQAAPSECMQLLGKAELDPRLTLHEAAQAFLQVGVLARREASARQRRISRVRVAGDRQHRHHRLVALHGQHRRAEADGDLLRPQAEAAHALSI